MKKLLFASVVAAMAFAVNASAQISVGAGYVNETVVNKEATVVGEDYSGFSWGKTRMQLNGFYVEAMYNWDFVNVGPGVLAIQSGFRYNCLTNFDSNSRYNIGHTDNGNTTTLKGHTSNRTSDHFVDIPVHFKYAYDIVPGAIRAYAFAGPVLSFGIAAKTVKTTKTNMLSDDSSVLTHSVERSNAYTGQYYIKKFDADTNNYEVEKGRDDKYKMYDMFDLKLALGLGVTISEKVDVKFGYNIGLLNRAFIKNSDASRHSVHSNVLYFGAAYNF